MSSRLSYPRLDFPYRLRPYQQRFLTSLLRRERRLFYLLWCARAGKDLTCFFAIVVLALSNPGRVFGYFFPTKEMARRILFDGRTDDGGCILDIIPAHTIRRVDRSKLCILLINGSKIQCLSSDKNKGDSAAGESWAAVVLSEFALMMHGSDLLSIARSRLSKEKGLGFLIINTTPRGSLGAGYKVWQDAEGAPNSWYQSKVTIADIYKPEYVERYISERGLDEFDTRRELYCDFFAPLEGAIYAHMLSEIKWVDILVDYTTKVFLGLDLGFKRDATSWWAFTVKDGRFVFVDFDIVFKGELDKILDEICSKFFRPLLFLPHDADRGGGCSALDRVLERRIRAEIIPRTSSVESEIKSLVKPFLTNFRPRFRDCPSVKKGVEYLKLYRRNTATGCLYHGTDGASDAADAFRYSVCGISNFLIEG